MVDNTFGGDFRSGFVTVIGRPNVGKSTLINNLVGQKVAIVSDKAQTTRNKIQAVLTTDSAQIVFLDTPGIHKPHHKLGEYMVKTTLNALREVDAILFLVDGSEVPGPGDRFIVNQLNDLHTPVILGINKIDRLDGDAAKALERYEALGDFHQTLPLSALNGTGTEALVDVLVQRLPAGPKYYPDDWVSDHPERFVIAELVREKILLLTRDEIPHSVAVDVESIERREDRDLIDVRVTIYVERDSQKGIVIGKNGSMLKDVGSLARSDIEVLLGTTVNLQLWVKVKKDWREKEGALRGFGYHS